MCSMPMSVATRRASELVLAAEPVSSAEGELFPGSPRPCSFYSS
jgi:hypothetical protein